MHKKHKFFWAILRPLAVAFLNVKFGYRYKKAENLPETYIVLSNHVTDYDPLFVAVSFKPQMYFVASEHIARWGFVYKLLEFLVAPIIRTKGTNAAVTVVEMLRKVRSGANVCMFAEGARSWDGVTAPILASTGKVIKSARCGLVTYKIQGGYFVSPNWSQNGTRRGPVYGSVVNVYTKEQIAAMSVKEINESITNDLYEDAYERQLQSPVKYKGKQIAYKMENMLFRCPVCGATDTMSSQKDEVSCSHCGLKFRYDEYGMLEGIPQKTVKELFAWLKEEVRKDAREKAAYTAPGGTLSTVAQHEEKLVSEGPIRLDSQYLSCGDVKIALEEILDMAMHGRRAIIFSTKNEYYELLPSEEANVLKFHMLFLMYKHGSINQYEGRLR